MVSLLYPWICFDMAEGDGGGSEGGAGGGAGGTTLEYAPAISNALPNVLAPPIIASPGEAFSPCPPTFRMIKSYDVGAINLNTGLPSPTVGESPGVAFGLTATPHYSWSVSEPHFRCIGFNGSPQDVYPYSSYSPPRVGQCFSIELHSTPSPGTPPTPTGAVKRFRVTEVLPGNTNIVNGGYTVQGISQSGSPFCQLASQTAQTATIPIVSFNPNHPQFWPGYSTGCTNIPCGQECDQSLTTFSPIQSPQYGCNYQAVGPLLPGQPCTQTESCASGYVWSSTFCKCVPITPKPQAKTIGGATKVGMITNLDQYNENKRIIK